MLSESECSTIRGSTTPEKKSLLPQPGGPARGYRGGQLQNEIDRKFGHRADDGLGYSRASGQVLIYGSVGIILAVRK